MHLLGYGLKFGKVETSFITKTSGYRNDSLGLRYSKLRGLGVRDSVLRKCFELYLNSLCAGGGQAGVRPVNRGHEGYG